MNDSLLIHVMDSECRNSSAPEWNKKQASFVDEGKLSELLVKYSKGGLQSLAVLENSRVIGHNSEFDTQISLDICESLYDYMNFMSSADETTTQMKRNANKTKMGVDKLLQKLHIFSSPEKGRVNGERHTNQDSSTSFQFGFQSIPPYLQNRLNNDDGESENPWCPLLSILGKSKYRGVLFKISPIVSCLMIIDDSLFSNGIYNDECWSMLHDIVKDIEDWTSFSQTQAVTNTNKISRSRDTSYAISQEYSNTTIVSRASTVEELMSKVVKEVDIFTLDYVQREVSKLANSKIRMICCPLNGMAGYVVGQRLDLASEVYLVIRKEDKGILFHNTSAFIGNTMIEFENLMIDLDYE